MFDSHDKQPGVPDSFTMTRSVPILPEDFFFVENEQAIFNKKTCKWQCSSLRAPRAWHRPFITSLTCNLG